MKVPGCQKQPCHCPAVSHWLLFGKEGVGTCSSVCIWSQSCAGSSSPGILESWEMENQLGFIAFDYFWKAGRQKVLSLFRLELHVDTDQTLKFTIQKFQFGFRLCPSICCSKVLPAGDCQMGGWKEKEFEMKKQLWRVVIELISEFVFN